MISDKLNSFIIPYIGSFAYPYLMSYFCDTKELIYENMRHCCTFS